MTTIIISPVDTAWVDPTADLLRARGMRVVRLGTLSIIGFLLMSDKIAAVMIHEDCVPFDWDGISARMTQISPASKFVIVPRDDPRSPSDLARLIAGE